MFSVTIDVAPTLSPTSETSHSSYPVESNQRVFWRHLFDLMKELDFEDLRSIDNFQKQYVLYPEHSNFLQYLGAVPTGLALIIQTANERSAYNTPWNGTHQTITAEMVNNSAVVGDLQELQVLWLGPLAVAGHLTHWLLGLAADHSHSLVVKKANCRVIPSLRNCKHCTFDWLPAKVRSRSHWGENNGQFLEQLLLRIGELKDWESGDFDDAAEQEILRPMLEAEATAYLRSIEAQSGPLREIENE